MKEQCQQVRLESYLDDELGQEQKKQVEEHLVDCAACRDQVQLLRLQADALRDEIAQVADGIDFAGFEDRVLAGVRAARPPSWAESSVFWVRGFLRQYRAVWVTSLVTAAVLLAVLVPWLARAPAGPGPGMRTAQVDNEAIIDAMEYTGDRSMVFTVSKNNTTVIWLYDFDQVDPAAAEGDAI